MYVLLYNIDLSSNSTRIVKELTVLAQLMIAHEDRLNIHELAG